jgi:L-lactate dehydrogenase complex protein LldG
MGSREEILEALRRAKPAPVALPELPRYQGSADLREWFARSLAEVGGRCVRVASLDALPDALKAVPEYAGARRIVSMLEGEPAPQGDPHGFADVDYCLVQGEFGVAENGAVWVTRHGGEQRAVTFLTQHLGIVVRGDTLAPTMHEAYERIALGKGFALFLSGPSKTADIEQALVIGAHGARSCTVFLVG